MSDDLKSTVYFHSLGGLDGPDLDQVRLAEATGRLVAGLHLPMAAGENWGVWVQLSGPGRPPLIDPDWAAAAGRVTAAAQANYFAFDTLSITQQGLHTVDAHLDSARAKGYGLAVGGPDFVVADDPDQGEAQVLPSPESGDFPPARLAGAAAAASGLILLSRVQSHPHLGFQGALAGLGLGLSDRQGKLDLHRDIRPRVDTPLCAGCGSCMSVCLFDAIDIRAGRAVIDHGKCVGCGECMTVCHMAGISPEESAGIPVFQQKVSAAGAAFISGAGWGVLGKIGYLNYLVHLDRRPSQSNRRAPGPRHIGILASNDPVALDRATWDLLAESALGGLAGWSGYHQEPGPLLERSASLGLGITDYRIVDRT